MSNGNGFDPMAQYARLSERVENQGKDIVDLRSNMNTGFQGVNSAISTLSNELRANSRTQWPVIWAAAGVCFTVLVTIGTFFYGTLSKGQDRLDLAIAKVADNAVSEPEMKWRTDRGVEDRKRTDDAIADIRQVLVPREELDRVFDGNKTQLADMQRQLDEVKQAQGSVYGTRDVLMDLRSRQDRLERELMGKGQGG